MGSLQREETFNLCFGKNVNIKHTNTEKKNLFETAAGFPGCRLVNNITPAGLDAKGDKAGDAHAAPDVTGK